MATENHGTERESQVRELAAKLGVEDFVYSAPPIQKGAGYREASGDGLLLVGNRGAVLQVKAREPSKGGGDSPERAASWIRKYAEKAAEQGIGTRRELARRQSAHSPMLVYPVRALGLSMEIKELYALRIEQSVSDWPVIVILDHPNFPSIDLGFRKDVVWFTFSDWWELQRRLRSTTATLTYVERILRDGAHVMLGNEEARYSAFRSADELSVVGSTAIPYLADGQRFDKLGTDIFHDLINKVWPSDGLIPWKTASEYRAIVEFLDALPPVMQSEVGRWVLRKRSEIHRGQRVSSGLVRVELRNRLVFICSLFSHWRSEQDWLSELTLLTNLRHIHALESGAPSETVTLGIGVLVEDRGDKQGVAYSFVMLIGSEAAAPIPKEIRAHFEWRYGIHNHATGTILESKAEFKSQ
jgi:hypothetical protein